MILNAQVVALNTELDDVKKNKEELEQAKTAAEETIDSERREHSEKVKKI